MIYGNDKKILKVTQSASLGKMHGGCYLFQLEVRYVMQNGGGVNDLLVFHALQSLVEEIDIALFLYPFIPEPAMQ